MPIIPTNTGRFYAYKDSKDDKRTAIISFVKKTGSEKWEFQRCEVCLLEDPYSLEDWEFLGEIDEGIREKLKELNEKE